MKMGAMDRHHRDLQTTMSEYTVTSHMHHLLTKSVCFGDLLNKWRICEVSMCDDVLS